jgi:hypothetical protein
MGCLPRRFAYSRDVLPTQSVLTPQTDKMYLKKFSLEVGASTCRGEGEPPGPERLTARAHVHTYAFHARTRAHALRAKVTLPCAPAPLHSIVPRVCHRLCTGFHAFPDGLMGAARSRHALLSAHKWACAATAGICPRPLPSSPSFRRPCILATTAFEPGPTRRCSAVTPAPAQL